MLIGLMGKSGSGKSQVSLLFKELDNKIQIIDVDKIGHMSHKDLKVRKKLQKYFGDEIFNEDLSVNRKKLGNIVFSDNAKMQLLYEATYEYMVSMIDKLVKESDVAILDYALLPLTKYYKQCDVKILVEATSDVRSGRVMKRDGITFEKYTLRDANSVDYTLFSFDYVIYNNEDIQILRKTVGEIYEKSIVSR